MVKVPKADKNNFIEKVHLKMLNNSNTFLSLTDYNAAKTFVRRIDPQYCGRMADNGHQFPHIMEQALSAANDDKLRIKWKQLQAAHRAKKHAKNNTIHTARQSFPSAIEKPKSTYTPAPSEKENHSMNSTPSASNQCAKETAVAPNSKERIDVYYGRTDDTTGYKEYSCVVVQTAEAEINYCGDIYCPQPDCHYEVLREIPMSEFHQLLKKEPQYSRPGIGWVTSPLKERILRYWKDEPQKSVHCGPALFI